MKLIGYFLFTFAIVLICNPEIKAQSAVAGEWLVDVNESVSRMNSETRQKFDALNSESQLRTRNAMTGRIFTFRTDGTAIVKWKAAGTDRVSSGTWAIDAENALHVTIGNDALIFDYEVLPGPSLVLKNRQGFGFFQTLYLTHP